MNNLGLLILFFVCCRIYDAHSQCTGNILLNGSFTSIEGEDVTAPSWTKYLTPDINDENGPLNTTPGYVWTGIPLASSNGGTWQDLFGLEAIEQTVNVTQGQNYTLCFEYAAQGIIASPSYLFANPVGVNVYINGVLSFTAPDDTTQYTWENSCYSFIATLPILTIRFAPTQTQYVGIDGACLKLDVNSSTNENLSAHLDFKPFPNPITNSLNITTGNNEYTEVILYDVASRKIMQEQFMSSVSLNTEHLTKGIYLYEVRTKNRVIKKGKVVKD